MTDKILFLIRRVIVAVLFLLGFHGIGHSMNNSKIISENINLSHRDSLIIEMVEFIQPEYKLSKKDRKHIEKRIKFFPRKILRRDTISHFLNTAYALTYYEFVKHDYKRAKAWGDDFVESAMPPGFFSYFFNYSSIGFSAANSLREKGKFKTKKDKNSWSTPIKLEFVDSVKYDFKRTYVDFIDSFLDNVPLDCSIITYQKLLTAYRHGEGRLELLNGYSRKGFIQRCVDAGRNDILNLIYALWGICREDLHLNNYGYLEYRNPTLKIDTTGISNIYSEIISFDVNQNKAQIDSLISVGSVQDLTPRIMRLLSQYFDQSRYIELVEACGKLECNVSSDRLGTLHNYWALGLSNLSKYEEALKQFDQAISHAIDKESLSTIRLNKGCTLGEMERTEEAGQIFMSERDGQTTPFEKFVWHDNLGYIYSFSNPSTALYYYEAAEKYLETGYLYLDRKVRHFCRKARVLEHNKFLQRSAIEKAFEYSRHYGCPDVAKGMVNTEFAVFMASVFDTVEADRLFREAQQYYEQLPVSDLRRIYLDRQHATNLCKLNCQETALEILSQQLELLKENYGKDHSEYHKTFLLLIQLLCEQQTPNINADELNTELCNIGKVLTDSNQSFDYIKAQVAFLVYCGKWREALRIIDDSLKQPFNPMKRLSLLQTYEQLSRKNLSQLDYIHELVKIIPSVKSSMIEGLLTLSSDEESAIHRPLSTLIDGAIDKGAFKSALELSLFRKGLLFTKKRTIEKQLSTKKEFKRLQDQRNRLNASIAYNDSTHIPEFSATVFQLERELANKLSRRKKINTRFDKTIQQVIEKLSSNNLAIEFVKYSAEDNNKYGAFLIDVTGLKKFISIGQEDDIVKKPVIVWDSIAHILPNYENVYFCPDGVLNSIGIEYLTIGGNTPINQLTNIHRVFHLSEINQQSLDLGEQVFVIGVSDHNSPIDSDESVNRGNWTDLPNVEYEIQLVTKALKDYRVTVLLNNEATEQVMTSFPAEEISTLHISTHGFYRDNKELNESARDSSSDDYQVARRFLSAGLTEVSGLVLRAGNVSWQSPNILDEYDDLWTSEEIRLMTFPKMNLTVLSACDTGLGEIDSDGVWGLQRAFRIAGSKSLICSLAKVDDYWTAQFMDAFYEYAANGNTIYDSFQKAQKWLYNELPDEPEVWTSFILIE